MLPFIFVSRAATLQTVIREIRQVDDCGEGHVGSTDTRDAVLAGA